MVCHQGGLSSGVVLVVSHGLSSGVSSGWSLVGVSSGGSLIMGSAILHVPPNCAGIAHLTFSKSGGHYTWRKVTTTVHNIIVGRLWVDNQGEMDITNHTSGDKCHLKYSAYSYFSREPPRKVLSRHGGGWGEAGGLSSTWSKLRQQTFCVLYIVPVRT